jgi:predicted amidohydrolase YtcJ
VILCKLLSHDDGTGKRIDWRADKLVTDEMKELFGMRISLQTGVLALILAAGSAVASTGADVVLRGGNIYTVDAARSWAQTVAIKGNEIVFVGLDSDADDYIGEHTRVVDLDGKMVLPGFQDSHIHPVTAVLKTSMCSLSGLQGVAAYLDRVQECVDNNPDAQWIHGAGWANRYFDGEQQPTKQLLDRIAPDTPLTLDSYDGHSLWANSKALEVAGIDEKTAEVASGEIVRFADSNEPTGLFLEDLAKDLVMSAKPPYSDAEIDKALRASQKYLNSLGITTVQDALVETGENSIYSVLPSYRRAVAAGDLSLRVVASLYWDPRLGMEQIATIKRVSAESSGGLLKANTVKVWLDGVMHTHTSRLLEDYADRPGERGTTLVPVERLNELTVALDKAGFQMHFHGDGDGAVRMSLDAVEQAIASNGRNDNRHHIAHLELVHPDDIPRFRELGVVANVQPMWSTSKAYISDLIEVKIGSERKRWLEINKSFLDQGVIVAYGSDWFVTSPNPMDLIEAAVTRIRPALPLAEKLNASPLLPGENVSVADAIASYTINGAYVNHQEQTTGSLEVGKLADIVVLDKNLFAVNPVRISETKVLLTFMDGKLVFGELPLQ